jgi:hypothetical protein
VNTLQGSHHQKEPHLERAEGQLQRPRVRALGHLGHRVDHLQEEALRMHTPKT